MIKKVTDENAILVVSCDAYKDLWKPFFHCFFKYWPDCPFPIFLASNFEKFDDDRVNSICYGEDLHYSTNLINIMAHIQSPSILLWFEDVFIESKIDNARFLNIIKLAKTNNAGYLKLTVDLPVVYVKDKSQEIGIIPKGVKYRSGIGLALYKRETLINLLEPGLSAWQLDQSGISNLLDDKFMALTQQSLNNPPLRVLNGVIKGKWAYGIPSFLRKEGLADCISGRETQSFWSAAYVRLYLFRSYLFVKLKIYWREKNSV
tara:strand:- start:11101 stop:11883 length:783 start_codon:yes stop_codon:yes gene_type:complete